ncbi:acyl-CoA N-acyltransferase [Rhexocercosporidium sp. MPI-PUGE-AT-0058]|nr:acyl-CoA N-acyltransferase [Rhexocercosporidium sp. MPI-PUGE-AT-0058]
MASSSFKVSPLTPADIPGAAAVFFSSFNSPRAQEVFPPTESGKKWLADSLAAAISNPGMGISPIVVTDESVSADQDGEGGAQGDNAGRRKVVAFATWVKHSGGEFPGWDKRWRADPPEGLTVEMLGPGFFDAMGRQHKIALGERPHFFLESISTLPEYRKRGLASKLIDWGLNAADELGWECYLDGAARAVALYERYGFVAMPERDPGTTSLPMVRPGKKV